MDIDSIAPETPGFQLEMPMDWTADDEMANSEKHDFSKKKPIDPRMLAQQSGSRLSARRPATVETTSNLETQIPRTRQGGVVAQLEALQFSHKRARALTDEADTTGNNKKAMGAMGQVNTPEPTADRSVPNIDSEEEEEVRGSIHVFPYSGTT